MINAPPPLLIAWAGKRKKLPRPTAFPAIANTRPTLEPQRSDLFAEEDMYDTMKGEEMNTYHALSAPPVLGGQK